MQSIRQCVQRLGSCNAFVANKSTVLSDVMRTAFAMPARNIHRSSILRDYDDDDKKFSFLQHNKTIFPPQEPGEERRPGFVCHVRTNIKYSPLKMWYVACFVRGMSVDEAVKQLSFLQKKGASIAKEVILEAQEMAVKEHNIEFKSNLWVAESFASKGVTIKGIRRHARARFGRIRYGYCHYFVRLEEGKPPKHYYQPAPKSGEELLQNWMEQMHRRKVPNTL